MTPINDLSFDCLHKSAGFWGSPDGSTAANYKETFLAVRFSESLFAFNSGKLIASRLQGPAMGKCFKKIIDTTEQFLPGRIVLSMYDKNEQV